MSKCKLVVSDMHISRGKLLSDGSVNLLEDFLADRQFIEFLNYYSSDKYFDSDVELILNGDILNLLQVDYRGYFSPILTESISLEKLESVIKGHPKVFEALAKFAQAPNHKVTYVIGNHDVEMIWEKTKELFSEALHYPVNFKNFTYTFDGVHIEHGHQFEVVNRLNPKRIFLTKDLKEPIINLPWGSHFVINFVIPMKIEQPAIDKVRPMKGFLKWIFLTDTLWSIKTAFRILLYFIGTRFSRSIYRTSNLVTTFKILGELSAYPSLEGSAQKILDLNEEVHTVILGHSHTPRYKQLKDGREYINTGTWTEVTSLDMQTLGRASRYTYAYIDYSKNPTRPHAYLKEWKGRWHEDIEFYAG